MTTGLDIVGGLLRTDDDILALVVEADIKGGRLSEDAGVNSIMLRETSSIEQRKPLKRGAVNRWVDRVSVTVRARSYREQRLLIRLVRARCAGLTGDIGGALRVAIRTSDCGPELDGPGNTFERTQDFRVSYDA